jgi:hypothetical protein
MNDILQALLESAAVWHAREQGAGNGGAADALPTGWPALDAALPDRGWPLGALIEVLVPEAGIGELRLFLPALRRLATEGATGNAWLAWIAPPHAPYAPALAQAGIGPDRLLLVEAPALQDRLWAMEQALASGGCSAALGWFESVDERWLRRLALAAGRGRTLAVLFRSPRQRERSSPARLRLVLEPQAAGLDVQVIKGRGGPRRVRNAFTG